MSKATYEEILTKLKNHNINDEYKLTDYKIEKKVFENGDWDDLIVGDTKQAYKYCINTINSRYKTLSDFNNLPDDKKNLEMFYLRYCIEADDGEYSGVAYPERIDWEHIKEDLEVGK
jgi:hypothetical protein